MCVVFWDSAVVIVARLMDRTIRSSIRDRRKICLLSKSSVAARGGGGGKPPPNPVPPVLSPGVKRPRRAVDHLHLVLRLRVSGAVPPFPPAYLRSANRGTLAFRYVLYFDFTSITAVDLALWRDTRSIFCYQNLIVL